MFHSGRAKQRAAFTCNNIGIRWDELDEDLSFEGFMQGDKDRDNPVLDRSGNT
jgi:hypothetical protein